MIVKAVKTNCCGKIIEIENAHGVIHKPDMFNEENDFVLTDPEKTNIHFCTDCYNNKVTIAVDSFFNKEDNVSEYRRVINHYAYLFKRSLFPKEYSDIQNGTERF